MHIKNYVHIKMAQSKDWVFTINNFVLADVQLLEDLECNYMIYQSEKGKQGTSHLQGFLQFNERKRMTQLKKIHPTAHWEKRLGTPEQARDYCKKEDTYDGSFRSERGTMTKQGRRKDIKEFVDTVLTNKSELQILEEHPNEYLKYSKVIDRIRLLKLKEDTKKFRKIEAVVYYGPPGSGKTRMVMDQYSDTVYKLSVGNDTKIWFDNYDGENVLLIDDYDGKFIPYEMMLALLDGYQLRLPIKGSHTYARYTKVFITSNKHPDHWYQDGLRALQRRINKIFFIRKEEATCLTDVKQTTAEKHQSDDADTENEPEE